MSTKRLALVVLLESGEIIMRNNIVIIAMAAVVGLFSGCAAWKGVTYTDDMYTVHDRAAIEERYRAEAELAMAQYEARKAMKSQYATTLDMIKAEAAKQGVTIMEDNANSYASVFADSYESAYARRLSGFSSPTYRLPSSYYTLRYSDAFHYASAYDPAFYNIMVSGDMVWAEPKYITAMFGSWGAAVVPTYGWYYGWDTPYFHYSTPYGWSHNFYWNYWNSPFFWSWYPPYYHHHYPHRPSHHLPPHVGSGGVGNTSVHHNYPGMVVGRNPGAARPAGRSDVVRPSSSGRFVAPSYRGGETLPSENRGSSSYRGGGESGVGSSYYRNNDSYNSGSSRTSSYGGGGSSRGGSYSGGGNSRGR